MYGFFLWISLLLMLYGTVRFFIAQWKREDQPMIHLLFVPAAAFLYAIGVLVVSLAV